MVVHRAALVPLALIFLVYFIATALGDLYPVEQLGAEFATREGRVTVLAVDPDSPAGRAGVRPGDRIITVDGRQVRNALDWGAALAWVDVDRPLSLLIDRDGSVNQADLQFRLRPLGAWGSPESVVVVLSRAVQFVTLLFAFGIAARGRGNEALFGSWLLATISIYSVGLPPRMAVVWQATPQPLEVLLYLPSISKVLIGYIVFAYFRLLLGLPMFDRAGILTAAAFVPCVGWDVTFLTMLLHAPDQVFRVSGYLPLVIVVNFATLVGAMVMLAARYRSLGNPSDRRRLRWIVAGSALGCAAGAPTVAGLWLGVSDDPTLIYHTPISLQLVYTAFLVMPISFWWATARRQLFDIQFVVRRGLQYLFARHAILVLTPITIALISVDAITHRSEPLQSLYRRHAALYLLAVVGLTLFRLKRAAWLEWIDRRLFRERYNSARILRDLATELRSNSDVMGAARFALVQVAAAMHPEWVAIYACKAGEPELHDVLSDSRDRSWPRSSRLMARSRTQAGPLDVQASGVDVDADDRRRVEAAALQLIVPLWSRDDGAQAVLMLGPKRSGEPYGQEDKTLLQAVGDSIDAISRASADAELKGTDDRASSRSWDERLWELADTVASGRAVDWDRETADTFDDDRRQILMELRALEGLMRAHGMDQPLDLRAPIATDLPAARWGHFELRDCLGRGRFGTVYRAWDPRLEREVALKLLDDDQIDRGAYLREARHLARVRHPNVVQVYGAEVYDGTAGFWMELVDGQTVAEIVAERGVMPAADVRQLAIALCGALAAIHRAGIVHQDVKAENVIRDKEGSLVLMDLGAGVRERVRPDTGTPRYMAPELFRGEGASARSDVYSLGVLLFFVATGTFPADGTYEEIAHRHEVNRRKALRELRADLDPAFLAAIDQAICVEPSGRFATADQFRALLTGEAV